MGTRGPQRSSSPAGQRQAAAVPRNPAALWTGTQVPLCPQGDRCRRSPPHPSALPGSPSPSRPFHFRHPPPLLCCRGSLSLGLHGQRTTHCCGLAAQACPAWAQGPTPTSLTAAHHVISTARQTGQSQRQPPPPIVPRFPHDPCWPTHTPPPGFGRSSASRSCRSVRPRGGAASSRRPTGPAKTRTAIAGPPPARQPLQRLLRVRGQGQPAASGWPRLRLGKDPHSQAKAATVKEASEALLMRLRGGLGRRRPSPLAVWTCLAAVWWPRPQLRLGFPSPRPRPRGTMTQPVAVVPPGRLDQQRAAVAAERAATRPRALPQVLRRCCP